MATITQNALQDLLDIIAEDENGVHVMDNEAATIGFVTEFERLQVSASATDDYGRPPDLNMTELGTEAAAMKHFGPAGEDWREENPYTTDLSSNNVIVLILLNADTLLRGAYTLESAVRIAVLRARWIKLGCLYLDRESRCVHRDEVDFIDNNLTLLNDPTVANIRALGIANYNAILDFLGTPAGKQIVTWSIANAELCWAISECVFRIRGHHYKDEYDPLIIKIYKASSNDNVDWPSGIPLRDVFRVAIHPFGIKALVVMTYKFLWWNKLSGGIITRLSGAPNGMAAITTACAGFSMISSEAWFVNFMSTYSNQVALISHLSRAIKNNKYAFHESASLYGLNRITEVKIDGETYLKSDMEGAVNAVAPILQGFIQWSIMQVQRQTGSRVIFSFAGAQVLGKRAQSNPALVMRTMSVLDGTISRIEQAETTTSAINQAFPMLTSSGETSEK